MKKILFTLILAVAGLGSCTKEVPDVFFSLKEGDLKDFHGMTADKVAKLEDREGYYALYVYEPENQHQVAVVIRYTGKLDMSDGKLEFKTHYLANCELECPASNITQVHLGHLWVKGGAMQLNSDGIWTGNVTFYYECTGWSEKKSHSDPIYGGCCKNMWYSSEPNRFRVNIEQIENYR